MQKYLVWDLPVRLFHWLLVICIFTQWLTAEVLEDATDIHFYVGYFTLGLILFRLIWAIIGPRYARFSNFLRGPKAIWAYAKQLKNRDLTNTPIGHNPIGGLMLPAILLLVGLQGVSGLFATDDIIFTGPYYASASDVLQDWMQWLHHNIFDLILILIAVHLVAIFSYQFALKLDLIRPMLSGKKAIDRSKGIPSSQLYKAILLAIIIGIFIFWLVEIAPPAIEEEYYY